ncbi:hypothetical protein D0Y65_049935 [Glycine soja]|uniref:DUF674 family protein n=2 Tax=Glycine soja TaxID=3848 RepID=A0A445FZ92_GLYSO|nr:hypothetical protein D0Y65_049935 [Glycine soja]
MSATMADIVSKHQVTLKLWVNKERNKVFFAKAEKDFVDVLISFLTLPLGTIVRLANKESNMDLVEFGSLSSLYKSVENLDNECLCTDTCKEMLLRPRNSLEAYCRNMKLNIDDTEPTKYLVCNDLVNCRHYYPVLLSTFRNKRCSCGNTLGKPISPESQCSNVFDGFVKSNATFMITDDLKVLSDSLNTILSVLMSSGLENASLLTEMTVSITKTQVILLLKSCLLSKTTLTDTFLVEKPYLERFNKIKLAPLDLNTNGSGKINIKIMQRKSNGKILFAQGKEDFANFLFSFLTFPLGAVVQLLECCSSIGSVDALYKSIVDLDEDYWTTKETKHKVVHPVIAPQFKLTNQLLPICDAPIPEYFCFTKDVYDERDCQRKLISWFLTSQRTRTKRRTETCKGMKFVDPISESGKGEGFAKGPTMYMATDDLVVTPMSSDSLLSLLNRTNILVRDLEEKEVSIGVKEGISILQASLSSTSALTAGLSHLLTKIKEEN